VVSAAETGDLEITTKSVLFARLKKYAPNTVLTLPYVVCVFIAAVRITKLFAWGVCVYYWEGDSGGHVLRETASRGLCGLVCPSRTSERGGEGYCVKEGGWGEGERERERALGLLLCHSPRA